MGYQTKLYACALRGLCVGMVGLVMTSVEIQAAPLEARDLPSLLLGLDILRSNKNPKAFVFQTWREPEILFENAYFELKMEWNGLDDENWPFVKILDVLVTKSCAPVAPGFSKNLYQKLVKSPSMTPSTNYGQGGESRTQATSGVIGSCRIDMMSYGARWNTLTAKVFYNGNGGGTAVPMENSTVSPSQAPSSACQRFPNLC